MDLKTENKFYIEANIELQEETDDLKEKASKVIELPKDKQQDLQYFSAILVSSGQNLNNAFFLGSELVSAEGTIVNKALDVEHSEEDIIGHIISREYCDKQGNKLDLQELASKETAGLDIQDMHIAIAGVIYKHRFPNLSKEIAEKKWSAVSMECYYQNYDIKIGNLTMSRKEAEALGLASSDASIMGRVAKVLKEGKEIAAGKIARVLRGIHFSGCGIVKNPANPASVILEVASEIKSTITKEISDSVLILDYDKLNSVDNNVTPSKIEEVPKDGASINDNSLGICVNYKRRVEDKEGNISKEDWCSAYGKGCTSFSRDLTDINCLRNQEILKEALNVAKARIDKLIKVKASKDRREQLLDGLKAVLREAVKIQSR